MNDLAWIGISGVSMLAILLVCVLLLRNRKRRVAVGIARASRKYNSLVGFDGSEEFEPRERGTRPGSHAGP